VFATGERLQARSGKATALAPARFQGQLNMGRWTRRELGDGAALCIELGSGLLENGAETSRVEESIRLAGESLGFSVETIVTPTGITVTFGNGEVITRVARIRDRVINLDKVAKLNRLSRKLQEGVPHLAAFREEIQFVRDAPPCYTPRDQLLATIVVCACFTLSVGGGWKEALVAVSAGLLGRFLLDLFSSEFPSFLSLFSLSFLSTTLGVAGAVFSGLNTEAIVVGSLLHRMPGLAIVSAVRDLMAGELVAGVARAAEAALITLGMASGVLSCLGFSMRLGLVNQV
jgi:uncharacterized membrane protein YjjP (DUF1212 family)